MSSDSLRKHPKLHTLDEVALGFLIQAQWMIGEATALGISLTSAEVHARYVKLRNEQFHSAHAFKAFLRSSGFTVSDLELRVRVQTLASRIMQRVVAGRSAKQQPRALAEFVQQFKKHWTSQTYCAAKLAIELCGHRLPDS